MIVTLRNRQTEYVTQAEFSDFKDEMYLFRDEVYERFDNMYSHIETRFKEFRKEIYEYMDRRFEKQQEKLHEDYERHTGMVVEQFRHELQLSLEFLKPLAEAFKNKQLAI